MCFGVCLACRKRREKKKRSADNATEASTILKPILYAYLQVSASEWMKVSKFHLDFIIMQCEVCFIIVIEGEGSWTWRVRWQLTISELWWQVLMLIKTMSLGFCFCFKWTSPVKLIADQWVGVFGQGEKNNSSLTWPVTLSTDEWHWKCIQF